MTIVILIGASGAGKTTLAVAIARRLEGEVDVLHFDAIGVPSHDKMIAGYGSPEGWQRAATIEWMKRLKTLVREGRTVLFEGQTRLSFIAEAAAAVGGLPYVPILVDCDDETRTRRLTVDRRQPELATSDMMGWAVYLRREAEMAGIAILDTSDSDPETCLAYLVDRLHASKSPDGSAEG